MNTELLFLPTYSPQFNLIERFWKLVKKNCLNTHYYPTFQDFKSPFSTSSKPLTSRKKDSLKSLLTFNFQSFKIVKIEIRLSIQPGPQLLLQAFSATHRQRWRADRTGIRIGANADGFVGDVAATKVEVRVRFKIVIELKLLHKAWSRRWRSTEQTWEYLDRCGAKEGHLVIFDRTPVRLGEEKLFRRRETVRGRQITVWGM